MRRPVPLFVCSGRVSQPPGLPFPLQIPPSRTTNRQTKARVQVTHETRDSSVSVDAGSECKVGRPIYTTRRTLNFLTHPCITRTCTHRHIQSQGARHQKPCTCPSSFPCLLSWAAPGPRPPQPRNALVSLWAPRRFPLRSAGSWRAKTRPRSRSGCKAREPRKT